MEDERQGASNLQGLKYRYLPTDLFTKVIWYLPNLILCLLYKASQKLLNKILEWKNGLCVKKQQQTNKLFHEKVDFSIFCYIVHNILIFFENVFEIVTQIVSEMFPFFSQLYFGIKNSVLYHRKTLYQPVGGISVLAGSILSQCYNPDVTVDVALDSHSGRKFVACLY